MGSIYCGKLKACGHMLVLVWGVLVAVAKSSSVHAEDLASGPARVQNVVLITLDGLRLEEVFNGADQRLMISELGVKDPQQCREDYWRESPEERRRQLMPFLWERVSQDGWIAGNVLVDSQVQVTNGRYFSYPGYSELLCGFADQDIDSNAKVYNRNVSVLEWIDQQAAMQGQVAAYCSWDVFPFILNDRRSGVEVYAGWSPLQVGEQAAVESLNFVAANLFHEWDSVRYDAFTTWGALQQMQQRQPRLLYVALGETDDWAHAGRYDRYLLSARQNDGFIKSMWDTAQTLDAYRDKTLFLVTSDHGRGDGREGWKSHGTDYPGSERIWVAAFGAGLSTTGIDQGGRFTQSQIAATVASALGYDFAASDPRIADALPIVQPVLD